MASHKLNSFLLSPGATTHLPQYIQVQGRILKIQTKMNKNCQNNKHVKCWGRDGGNYADIIRYCGSRKYNEYNTTFKLTINRSSI